MEKTIYAEGYRALLVWLRNRRKNQGLTMRDLAKRLGVHHSWIGRIEQGERRLDIAEFSRLCREIGCDPREGLTLVANPVEKKIAPESQTSYGSPRPKSSRSRRTTRP